MLLFFFFIFILITMETVVLILCAGSQTRWNKDHEPSLIVDGKLKYPVKQLIDIKGVPLLKRTEEQLIKRGFKPIIITNNEEIKSLFPNHFIPKSYSLAVETLYNTQSLWG